MMEIEWHIECYERDGDGLVKKIRLLDVELPRLRTIFGEPPDSPMCDMYPVREAHLPGIKEATGLDIDIDSFDCFLSATDVTGL